jgi:uncharacterized membrane protein
LNLSDAIKKPVSPARKITSSPVFTVAAIAVGYTLLTIFITFLIHNSYHTYAFDLGLFTQSLKNTLQGEMLWHPCGGASELAHHFSPVLFLLVPVYWVFPYAQTLLVVQGILLGISGCLVYLLVRDYGFSHRTGLLIEVLFFINPLVWGVALFDFHPVVFAIPALLVMFLGMKRRKPLLFAAGLFIALVSKEDVIIAVGVFGLVLLITRYWKNREISRQGLVILFSAVLMYGIAVGVSALNSLGESPRILTYFTNRYTYLNQPEANTITRTVIKTLMTFFSLGSLFLICGYLVPLGFLPLLSLTWSIPGLLILLSGMLSTATGQHEQLMQYSAAAIPFLFMAFIDALSYLNKNQQVQSFLAKTEGRVRVYAVILVVIASISMISAGRIQEAEWPDSHDAALSAVLAAIPDGASVTAVNNIYPHLCTRTDVYVPRVVDDTTGIVHGIWGYPEKETEFVVVDYRHKQKTTGGFWEYVIRGKIDNRYEMVLEIDGARLYRLR